MKIFNKADHISNNIISASTKTISGNTDTHGHNFFEMEFIIDGTGIYKIDEIEYKIQKNTLFLMSPANVHEIIDANATLINVMFSYEHNDEMLDIPIMLASSPCFILDDSDGDFVKSLLLELVKSYETDLSYTLLLINCVLNKLYRSYKSTVTNSPSYIKQAILFLLENFQSNVTLADTAKHLGLSSAYFSDFFHKELGISFKEYLDDIRFTYATKLLSLTPLSVKEILFKSGFCDYANFTRRFKRKYGLSPTDYRNRNNKNL